MLVSGVVVDLGSFHQTPQHWLLSVGPVVEEQSPGHTQASPTSPETAFWLLSNNLLFIEDCLFHSCEADNKTHSIPILLAVKFVLEKRWGTHFETKDNLLIPK